MTKEDAINILIKEAEVNTDKISDGYHTFEELYDHRVVLFIRLCNALGELKWTEGGTDRQVWRSLCHGDGSHIPGWFIMGIGKLPGSQISYHLPEKYWDLADVCETLDKAPDWDGHTPADVLKRLESI